MSKNLLSQYLRPISFYLSIFLVSFNVTIILPFSLLQINTLAAGSLIINEFVPAPSSRSCSPHGNLEKVELFNSGETALDISTYTLRDKSGTPRNLVGSSQVFSASGVAVSGNIVPVDGYVVMSTMEGWLNNTVNSSGNVDGVYLYNKSILVDSQDYTINGNISDIVYRRSSMTGGNFATGVGSTFGRSNESPETPGCPPNSSSSSSAVNSSLNSSLTSSSKNSSVSSNNSSSISSISSLNSSSISKNSSSVSSANSVLSSSSSPKTQKGNLTVCKEDNLGNKLAAWDFNLKNSTTNLNQKTESTSAKSLIQTLQVSGFSSQTTPSLVLPSGSYEIKVSGTYTYFNDIPADAEYSLRPKSTTDGFGNTYKKDTWVSGNNLGGSYTGMLKLKMNNQNVNWGENFNPNHIYTTQISKGDNSPINFSIPDTQFTDNKGSLKVEITRLAEQNGCTTFRNVDYSNYVLSESMQNSWKFKTLKGNGIDLGAGADGSTNFTVNKPESQITFVNEQITTATPGFLISPSTGDLGGGPIIMQNVTNIVQKSPEMKTAVKGIEDSEDAKSSTKSANQSQKVTENEKTTTTESNNQTEVKIVLVPKEVSENQNSNKSPNSGSLIRTGGSENLQFVSGILFILMGSGLYISFKTKSKKISQTCQLEQE